LFLFVLKHFVRLIIFYSMGFAPARDTLTRRKK